VILFADHSYGGFILDIRNHFGGVIKNIMGVFYITQDFIGWVVYGV
jgi:hypothetical protein